MKELILTLKQIEVSTYHELTKLLKEKGFDFNKTIFIETIVVNGSLAKHWYQD